MNHISTHSKTYLLILCRPAPTTPTFVCSMLARFPRKNQACIWHRDKYFWTIGSYYIFKNERDQSERQRTVRESGRLSWFYKIKREVSEHSRFFSLISDRLLKLYIAWKTGTNEACYQIKKQTGNIHRFHRTCILMEVFTKTRWHKYDGTIK